jgi:hypothetical protein
MMMSPVSISTQSQAGTPSTLGVGRPEALRASIRASAMARHGGSPPEAMIIASASEVLPTRSMTVMSSAFIVLEDAQGEGHACRRRDCPRRQPGEAASARLHQGFDGSVTYPLDPDARVARWAEK